MTLFLCRVIGWHCFSYWNLLLIKSLRMEGHYFYKCLCNKFLHLDSTLDYGWIASRYSKRKKSHDFYLRLSIIVYQQFHTWTILNMFPLCFGAMLFTLHNIVVHRGCLNVESDVKWIIFIACFNVLLSLLKGAQNAPNAMHYCHLGSKNRTTLRYLGRPLPHMW